MKWQGGNTQLIDAVSVSEVSVCVAVVYLLKVDLLATRHLFYQYS